MNAIICFQDYDDVEHAFFDLEGVNKDKFIDWIGGEFIALTQEGENVRSAKNEVKARIKALNLDLGIAKSYIEKNKHRTADEWKALDEEYLGKMAGLSGYFTLPSTQWKYDLERPQEIKNELKQLEGVLL